MTAPRPPGPADPDSPPEWFRQAQQEQANRDAAERVAAQRERQQQEQARRAHAEREQAFREQAQRDRSRHSAAPPGRQVRSPVRQNESPWTGAPPGAMFPAAEDATMLIQRITDEALPRDVREAATVMHYPADVDLITRGPAGPPADPEIPQPSAGAQPNASAGMKTSTTAGVVRAGALMAVATVVSRATGLLSKVAMLTILGTGISSSACTVANTLPNIVFELLIGGGADLGRDSAADLEPSYPIPTGGQEYTQRLLTIAAVGLVLATVVAVFCAPLLARLYLSDNQAGDESIVVSTSPEARFAPAAADLLLRHRRPVRRDPATPRNGSPPTPGLRS